AESLGECEPPVRRARDRLRSTRRWSIEAVLRPGVARPLSRGGGSHCRSAVAADATHRRQSQRKERQPSVTHHLSTKCYLSLGPFMLWSRQHPACTSIHDKTL